ncbi:HAD family hydrolase [Criblamydia sequanensis]|uniref:phosphoserine phosphatase n=1 Tax=Candidatus Criblamydia sequanensis CRIB-18 TaxID=1437425 RepID=A0A090CY36_9BACT|nr:HAD family hydrolase [Criblamydia sequanensis]CDR33121.1 Conserved putative secreted protein [Criblamydia sequanensis CRIB-18]
MKANKTTFLVFIFLILSFQNILRGEADPLPSWNQGLIKDSIIQFVKETTDPKNENFIPVAERIAVFDQDGTLWVEQPIYTQVFFALDAIKAMALGHPEWKHEEPFKSILENNLEVLKNFKEQEVSKLIAATHSGLSVNRFKKKVRHWLNEAIHPHFKKPFTELVYQPMLEVIQYLKDANFKVYIVSGGGQEFMRAYAEKVYGIPPEQIIGTAGKVKYEYENGEPILKKLPEVLFVDDKTGKPEAINLMIGRKPYAAFGNSIGDKEMLEWTNSGPNKRLMLLVHHDDPIREYAYGPNSKIGTFPEPLMEEANQKKWHVVSMRKDWKIIFPFEKNP